MSDDLRISSQEPVQALNAGLFVSTGKGIHATRRLDSQELLVVRTGGLTLFEDEQLFALHPGQSLILWPGRIHGGISPFEPDLSFYWIHFRVASATGSPEDPQVTVPQLTTLSRPERLYELLHRFIDDQETSALLVMLMLSEVSVAAGEAQRVGVTNTDLAERVDHVIASRFHNPIGTAEIAEELHYNPDYLGRVFRRCKGLSITEALNRKRVNEARALLRMDSMTVQEIAHTCGFSDVGYFRILFKRYSGMPPATFRRGYSHLHINSH